MPSRPPALEIAPLLKGLIMGLPAVKPLVGWIRTARGRKDYWGGADEAGYSYGVWLKHIALLQHVGMPWPKAVAEFGPGDCIGVGIAALLSGIEHYSAYDTQPFALAEYNVALVDAIAALLRTRAPRPTRGWPDFDWLTDPGLFPSTALSDARLEASLGEENVARIKISARALSARSSGPVQYVAPYDARSLPSAHYDLILSHSVLEYIDDLTEFFRLCAGMLRPGGWMSHQVDLSSLGITRLWNGHLAYPAWAWRLVLGGREWGPNRARAAAYLTALEESGFSVVWASRKDTGGGLTRESVAADFREVSNADLCCGDLFVIARLIST